MNGGVGFFTGGVLHLEDCVIRNGDFGFGIEFAPSTASELYISNCTISSDNPASAATGGGIRIKPIGSGSAKVFLDNVHVENNRSGIVVDRSETTGSVVVVVRHSTVVGNRLNGVVSKGSGTIVRLSDTTVSGNGTGLLSQNAGQIISHGDNIVVGNTTNGAFTSTVAKQ